jgi:hypothetical protein
MIFFKKGLDSKNQNKNRRRFHLQNFALQKETKYNPQCK